VEISSYHKYTNVWLVLLACYLVPSDFQPSVTPGELGIVAGLLWHEQADPLEAHRPLARLQPSAFLTDQFLELLMYRPSWFPRRDRASGRTCASSDQRRSVARLLAQLGIALEAVSLG
jgi:hypothetical protein